MPSQTALGQNAFQVDFHKLLLPSLNFFDITKIIILSHIHGKSLCLVNEIVLYLFLFSFFILLFDFIFVFRFRASGIFFLNNKRKSWKICEKMSQRCNWLVEIVKKRREIDLPDYAIPCRLHKVSDEICSRVCFCFLSIYSHFMRSFFYLLINYSLPFNYFCISLRLHLFI